MPTNSQWDGVGRGGEGDGAPPVRAKTVNKKQQNQDGLQTMSSHGCFLNPRKFPKLSKMTGQHEHTTALAQLINSPYPDVLVVYSLEYSM